MGAAGFTEFAGFVRFAGAAGFVRDLWNSLDSLGLSNRRPRLNDCSRRLPAERLSWKPHYADDMCALGCWRHYPNRLRWNGGTLPMLLGCVVSQPGCEQRRRRHSQLMFSFKPAVLVTRNTSTDAKQHRYRELSTFRRFSLFLDILRIALVEHIF